MKTEDRRVCPSCGNEFSGAVEFCPVCMLQGALADDVESGESSSERGIKPKSQGVAPRFQHYELLIGEDGKPFELGHGAMGVTYKAFDIDLRCPVTLKVISEKYLGDESARLRFLREARAAASVRHPNVASVFHLGKSGGNYFYAMEFVEGETLENLVRRTGRLDAKLALEIVAQVAGGLAAVHKKGLVHRDIKPSNIMVNFEDEGAVTAKIIDLGLAKVVNEAGSQTAISVAGGFAGTPEFASPEQFAGVGADIRSDLYSLGVALWEMVTGHVLFRGSPAEVMYQHQHAPLPLEQLESVPQPVVSLIEVLLDKDPKRRFQTPADLLKALPTITGAIDEGRTITYQSLRQMPAGNSYALTRKAPRRRGPEKISIARLPVTGSDIFGREEDIAFLDDSWANQDVNVVTIVAWAGVGKSTLVNHWLRGMASQHYRSAELVFGWSFYRQGSSGDTSSADEFFHAALAWFGDPDPRIGTPWEKGERLAKLISHRRTLLILDGLEPLQNPPGAQEGRLREPSLQALLKELAAFNTGLCVITTRLPVSDIADHERTSALRRDLEHLSSDAGANLLRALRVKGGEAELRSASDEFNGHCLALTLLGSYLTDAYDGDIRCRKEVSEHLSHDVRQGAHARKVMESYQTWFGEGPELSVLRMLGLFDRPADQKALGALLKSPAIPDLTESLTDLSPTEWRTILARLRRARLLAAEDQHNPGQLDTHPLVREYFGEQLRSQRTEAWKECNRRGLRRYCFVADKLTAALPLERRLYALAQEQNEPTLMIGACAAAGGTHYWLGDFETAWQYNTRALQIWRSGGVRSAFQEVDAQPVACLSREALLQWHFGETASCHATIAEAISLARELHDMHGLAVALHLAASLAYYERNAAELERLASDLIELATRHGFAHWLPVGEVFRGWTRSVSGNTSEGLRCIEKGIVDYCATGSIVWVPSFLALKAEALHFADRTLEALESVREAEVLVEIYEERSCLAELHRLRGVFLASIGAEETQIEASFCEALRIAREQKSVSLEKRAEATYAEYRRQKASGLGGRGFRLPLC
jgi:serine/threonine protein kinase/tetratricopeptide (TPR) repeat protein